jgi:large subunit ribosomal protein L17
MRHYKKGRKLGTDASHTAAIKKNLVVNLFLNDRIKTTLERAKEIRGDVDRVITWAKRGDVHSRRLAIAKLGDKQLVAEIFAKVEQGLFKDRPGGYSRIFKVGKRRGDDAIIVLMELVQEPVQFKKKAADEGAKGGLKVEKKPARGKKNAEEVVATEETADEAVEAELTEEAVAEEVAAEEAPVEEAVSEEAVTEEAVTEEAVTEEAPAEEAPAEEAPAEEAAEDEATEETPAEEAAEVEVTEEAPAEEAPAEEAPAEEADEQA